MGLKYPETHKNWTSTNILSLFDGKLNFYKYHTHFNLVNLLKEPIENSKQVVKNLEFYCKDVTSLVIWTDCDREGEAIGFDIIDVCKRLNRNIDVYRAHFSAMTFQDISGAMQRLTPPNRNLSEAVKVRQEIDLRIGASFTRFQTLLLRAALGN